MRVRPAVASVVGQTDEFHWGQVLLTPHAYGVVEVKDPDGIARTIGISLLAKLTERLARSVAGLRALEEIADEAATSGVITLILLVPVGKVIYLVVRGSGVAFLKRGETLARLMDREGGLSGEAQLTDTVLIATEGFSNSIDSQKLISVFDHLPPAEVAEKLTLLLHEQADGIGGAALIFQVSGFDTVEEEAPRSRPQELVASRVKETVFRLSPGFYQRAQRLSRRLPRVTNYLKAVFSRLRSHRRLRASALVGLLLVIFIASIAVGISRERRGVLDEATGQAVAEAQHLFDEGVALLELNPVKGRERLTQAKELLSPYMGEAARQDKSSEVTLLYGKIVDNLTVAMQVVKTEPEVFFDIGLLKKGSLASSMALSADTMGLGDKDTRTVYSVSLTTKSGKVVGGGEFYAGLSQVAVGGDTIFAAVDEGIHAAGVSDKPGKKPAVAKSDQWGTIRSIGWYGGNLYLLDTTKNRIWKYVAAEAGFSDIREYLAPDSLPDLSAATSMAIDGTVWLGTSTGKILRFSQGKEVTFAPKGISPDLGTYLVVYTDDSLKNLYLLDRDNRRVVVLDKDGTYLAQYIWEKDLAAESLVVSEKAGKILLLAGGSIYAVALK